MINLSLRLQHRLGTSELSKAYVRNLVQRFKERQGSLERMSGSGRPTTAITAQPTEMVRQLTHGR